MIKIEYTDNEGVMQYPIFDVKDKQMQEISLRFKKLEDEIRETLPTYYKADDKILQ